MEGYEVEPDPFYVNPYTAVGLFHGTSKAKSHFPVILKRHSFDFIQDKSVQQHLTHCLNAALAQAKVQHPNSCKIHEVQLEIEKNCCAIYHVLEALDRDVGRDIEERKRRKQPFSETELQTFLLQISSALACAHRKVACMQGIAHRDLKPANIFRTGEVYKVGDFGCFFLKKDSSLTVSAAGQVNYMSPQLKRACMEGSQYNAFKADVFGLGATLLELATLRPPAELGTQEGLDDAVRRTVVQLPYSQQFQRLLQSMLASTEASRPSMQEVHSAAEALFLSPPLLPVQPLVYVDRNCLNVFDLAERLWTSCRLSTEVQLDGGSHYVWIDSDSLFCSGGRAQTGYQGSGREAYQIACPQGSVTKLTDMSMSRYGHGLWSDSAKHRVLCFGGCLFKLYARNCHSGKRIV